MSQRDVRPLFSRSSLDDKITELKTDIGRDIQGMGRGLVDKDAEQLAKQLADKYQLPSVRLKGHEARVKDGVVEYAVGYVGHGEYFRYRPSHFSLNVPQADVISDTLYMYYYLRSGAEAVKAAFESDYANLRQWMGWLTEDISKFNDGLEGYVAAAIEQRLVELRQEMEVEDVLNS